MLTATYPVANRLSEGLRFNPVRRPLLGQITDDATFFDAVLRSFYSRPDCVEKVTLNHGREALDALGNKVAGAMSSTPRGSVELTSQETALMVDIRGCLDEGGIPWTPIIVLGVILGFVVVVTQPWSK